MSNAVFPTLPGRGWSIVKTPIWKTVAHESVSGMELRSTMLTYPRYRISLSFDVLRARTDLAEVQALMSFFNLRKGAFDSFLWMDPDDNSATAQAFGTGDGSTKSFTIGRDYGAFREPVLDFVAAPTIYAAGVAQSSAGYAISKGVITFGTAPSTGAALTWSGQFYKRVRFVKDELDFEEFMKDLWQAKKVEMITVKQ